MMIREDGAVVLKTTSQVRKSATEQTTIATVLLMKMGIVSAMTAIPVQMIPVADNRGANTIITPFPATTVSAVPTTDVMKITFNASYRRQCQL